MRRRRNEKKKGIKKIKKEIKEKEFVEKERRKGKKRKKEAKRKEFVKEKKRKKKGKKKRKNGGFPGAPTVEARRSKY